MKLHTSSFKNQIKTAGRELDVRITYKNNGENIILTSEDINNITPSFHGNILKSVMKELEFDSNINIPMDTIIHFEFGIRVNDSYEYLNFGNYVVYLNEKQEDTNSYKIYCYDKMLYSMKTNDDLGITYPITIHDYINTLCNKLGFEFANKNTEFVNYDRVIEKELYFGLDYTYRDILDELAQVTASTICLNNNDELEIRYINNTGDIIDEEFLKDVNVKFGTKYGPINSIVLSRSAESDNVFLRNEESVTTNGLCEIRIIDNQIMNWNDRSDYLPQLLEKLNGLKYYINDFTSTGIGYYDLCDRYSVQVGDEIYSCIMFNDEIEIDQGIVENIFTEMPNESETDYSKADKTDRRINQVYIIADKQGKQIEALVSETTETKKNLNNLSTPILTKEGNNHLCIEDALGSNAIEYNIEGKCEQDGSKIKTIRGITNLFDGIYTQGALNNDGSINSTINIVLSTLNKIPVKPNTTYFLNFDESVNTGFDRIQLYDINGNFISRTDSLGRIRYYTTNSNTYYIRFATIYDYDITPETAPLTILSEEKIAHSYVPYGTWLKSKVIGKNLFDGNLEQGTLDHTTGANGNDANSIKTINYIEVKPNTIYTLKNFDAFIVEDGSVSARFCEYDKNKNFIKNTWISQKFSNWIITTSNTTKYIRFNQKQENSEMNLNSRIMLVEDNNEPIEFEWYKEEATLVNFNKPNLFDKDNTNILNALLSTGGSLSNASKERTLFINCLPNTTYTITKIAGKRLRVDERTEIPTIGSHNVNMKNNDTSSSLIYTTSQNANYLLLTYYFADADTLSEQEILNSIKIYEGYEPYYELCSIEDVKDNFEIVSGTLLKRIGKNESGYYILDEEEVIQLTPTNIPLFEGENHIQLEEDIETDTSVKYYRLNSLNEAYYTKAENDAQFKITSDQINSTVSSTKTELKNDLNDLNNNLNNNFYQKTQVEQLILDSSNGLTNTFSEAGGNNILRNTNFSAKEVLEEGQIYEYWYGNAIRNINSYSANGYSITLQNNSFYQEQSLANGNYTLSFFYRKTNPLANVYVKVNDNQYELDSTDFSLFQTGTKDENESYITEPIVITDNHVKVEFICDIDNACEVYDIMLNAGKVKLAYSQNQNETITDTVNIGRGISIKSSASDTEFVANNEAIGFKNNSGNFTTEFNSKGMSTNEAVIKDEAEIVGILRQRVGDQIWDCML